jgi:hypothetical protein
MDQKKKRGSKQHKLKNFKDWQVNESRPTNPCVQSIWDWKVNVQKTKWNQRRKQGQKKRDGSKLHKYTKFKYMQINEFGPTYSCTQSI